MFLFADLSENPPLTNHRKGVLFEGLIRELLSGLGYIEIELRSVVAGKEYDIHAIHKLDKRSLVGQAKAWERSVSASDVAEFVGTMEVEDVPEDALGLFVALMDFTPNARNYLSKLRSPIRKRVTTLVGKQIIDDLSHSGYVSIEEVNTIAEQSLGMKPSDTYLLVCDRGNYFVQLLARPEETRPKAYCVIGKSGIIISDEEFSHLLSQHIPSLKDLEYLTTKREFVSSLDSMPGPVSPGPEGATWFEYKLPAPPNFFIGRETQVNNFAHYMNAFRTRKTALPIYQVLSPSGVGKSSFLIKLNSILGDGSVSAFQDARNYRGRIDLLYLLQEFLEQAYEIHGEPKSISPTTEGVIKQIKEVDNILHDLGQMGVLFIDQFEAVFQKPELYAFFIDLVIRISSETNNIVFCIARRNDQPTTYDERVELDLHRLTELAKSIEIQDFSRDEAISLLSHLSDEIGEPLKQSLLNLALEFAASGYPWLCKRVGAHIIDSVVNKKQSQDELIQGGIKPEELFEADLTELDLMDREFLKDLALYLPATLDELSEKYPGKLLATKMKQLQDLRLIRIIGRTYDTYNDLFKEYLRTGEVPLPTKYAFRSAASTCHRELRLILETTCSSVHELEDASRLSSGTIQNVLRELRMLGLLETVQGNIHIDQAVMDANENGELDQLIAERVLKRNGLVPEVLNRLASEESITLSTLQDFLQEGLPLIEATTSTWKTYSKTFAGWLRFTGIVRPGLIVNEDGRAIGATRLASTGDSIFLPSVYISQMVSFMERYKSASRVNKDEIDSALSLDAYKLGLIKPSERGSSWMLTKLGERFVKNEIERPKILAQFLESIPFIVQYLNMIEEEPHPHLDVLKAVLGDMAFTEETWHWRSKTLANWLVFSQLVSRKKGKVIRSSQKSLFGYD